MTSIASSVAYQATVPQWTASASVPQELHAWWLIVLEHIRVHESQHIRIFDEYVGALPARIVGQPCGSWDAIIAQWSADLLAAQSAFDADEADWELPAYTGPLDW
jgi:predicted secreted Zn-dependent protease